MKRRLPVNLLLLVVLATLSLCTRYGMVQAAAAKDAAEYSYDEEYSDEYNYDEESVNGDNDKLAMRSSTTTASVNTATSVNDGGSNNPSTGQSPTSTTTIAPFWSDEDDREEFACPKVCSCNEGTQFVDCSNRSLTNVPDDLPKDTVRLDLSHNNIKQIPIEAFQNCTDVREIVLAWNVIEQFDKEILLKLERLDVLDLSGNQLAHLEIDAFTEASALHTLRLDENPIVIPDTGPFLDQPELEDLFLVNCNLTELPEETFSGLTGLKTLDISGNQFDEDMSVSVFEPLAYLVKLKLPALSESSVRDLCEKVQRIDVIDITVHNISCFYLASETSFEESIIVDAPKVPEPIKPVKEPTTARPTKKQLKNGNEIKEDYKSSTASALSYTSPTPTVPSSGKTSSQRSPPLKLPGGSGPSSASITHSSEAPTDIDVVKTSSSGTENGQSLLASLSTDTMKQLLMAIIGVTVLGLIVGLICRRTGVKSKLCGTKRRPAPTDQVRPAEEVPLNKV